MQRVRELGWIDGRTVAIEYRWAEGRSERYTEIADEFVRLNVNVIVTVGSAVPAANSPRRSIQSEPVRLRHWHDRAAMSHTLQRQALALGAGTSGLPPAVVLGVRVASRSSRAA